LLFCPFCDEFVDKTVSEMVADDLPQLLALRAQPF
jgi:hypothetical protein